MDVLGLRGLKTTAPAQQATETLKINLDGCDDGTAVEGLWTPSEVETLLKFARLVNANCEYGCQVDIKVWHNGEKVIDTDDD